MRKHLWTPPDVSYQLFAGAVPRVQGPHILTDVARASPKTTAEPAMFLPSPHNQAANTAYRGRVDGFDLHADRKAVGVAVERGRQCG